MRSGSGERRVCLVTGAQGLVGQHLLPALACTWDVIAVTRTSPTAAAPSLAGITYVERDLAAPDFTRGLPARIDAVIHLAQSRRFREVPEGTADVLAVNVAATEQLARYAATAGASHFVLASTGSVYAPNVGPIDESSPLATPETSGWYAGSKLAAEAIVQGYKAHFIPVVLRPFFVYGAGQRRTMMIPRLADTIARGDVVTLSGDDGMLLTPTHASDAAGAFMLALALTEAATIDVCGPETLSLRAMCECLGDLIGRPPNFSVGSSGGAAFSVRGARMRELLGAPTCTFRAGAPAVIEPWRV